VKRGQASGETLLTALRRELGRSLSPDQRLAFDGFVRRNFRKLSARLDQWILDDSRKHSRRAFPDAALFGDDWMAREAPLLPILGNFWAMDALVRRATERGPECRERRLGPSSLDAAVTPCTWAYSTACAFCDGV